jgi:AhpD family alkylhydroperoxidase
MAHLKLENLSVSPITQEIFDKTQKAFGFIPNSYKTTGANPALLDAYIYSYNSFRANAGFNATEQEVVFLTAAYENNCEYCVAAHSTLADIAKVPTEVTDAIRNGIEIKDPKLAQLSKLTRSLALNRGVVSQEEVDAFIAVGYTEQHVLGVLAGIAVKLISNYSNHITKPTLDDAFSARVWKK